MHCSVSGGGGGEMHWCSRRGYTVSLNSAELSNSFFVFFCLSSKCRKNNPPSNTIVTSTNIITSTTITIINSNRPLTINKVSPACKLRVVSSQTIKV
ncbi:hypothetical protein PoB_007068900 [Plakobranchus ocellatus]|uniref:Uncharacterized protein n=1 Tax=Plakobranchus ocellatus TaxID=259542 RepID=A0AAV4DJ11_9GAST|nr:hypothetical protein PoB_007068900 [Plakobranchus ocellatus]